MSDPSDAGFGGQDSVGEVSGEDTIEAQAAAQTGQRKIRIRIDESKLQSSYISGFRPTI